MSVGEWMDGDLELGGRGRYGHLRPEGTCESDGEKHVKEAMDSTHPSSSGHLSTL